MDTEKMFLAFFKAENERNWTTYVEFLHPDIIWSLHGSETKVINGINEYLSTIKMSYMNNDSHFICKKLEISNDEKRVMAFLVNDKKERSLDVFEMKNGLIYREYEFLLDA